MNQHKLLELHNMGKECDFSNSQVVTRVQQSRVLEMKNKGV